MKATVIMPTYNERANIGKMIEAIHEVRTTIEEWDLNLLIVDDNSPDKTQDLVKKYMKEHDWVQLITGQKQGLGAAYIRGMNHILSLDSDAIFEMDADFSHDPRDIPRMLKTLDDGADFVIGSRYIPGGKIPEEWRLWRKLNSWGGNLVARNIAGMYRIRDCTAGFRAIRVSLLRKAALDDIATQGYGFQVSLLHEAYINNAKITEIPVHFIDRQFGESKLGWSDILEFIINAFAIRMRNSQTFLRFLAVGMTGVFVNLGLFWLLQKLNLNIYLASPIAIEGSILWNFLLNNYWTFAKRDTQQSTATKGLKFNIVSLISLGISYTTFVLLTCLFPEGSLILFQAAGIIPASLINYAFNSYWTFKPVD